MPTRSPEPRDADLHVDGEGDECGDDESHRPSPRRQCLQAGAAKNRLAAPTTPAMPTPAVKNSNTSKSQTEEEQQVGHRRACHGVEDLVDETEPAEPYQRRFPLRQVPLSLTVSVVVSRDDPVVARTRRTPPPCSSASGRPRRKTALAEHVEVSGLGEVQPTPNGAGPRPHRSRLHTGQDNGVPM